VSVLLADRDTARAEVERLAGSIPMMLTDARQDERARVCAYLEAHPHPMAECFAECIEYDMPEEDPR
jgi:hypothetical protein